MKRLEFVYRSSPARVVFGEGALGHLERELDLLQIQNAMVLCTPEQQADAQTLVDRLGSGAAGLFPHAVMHVPGDLVRRALELADELGVDGLVALGGGSTIGLAKAMALESSLPILAIPTTYAGSEMTSIYGVTEAHRKHTGRNDRVLPRTVIYDPLLTLSLPVDMSAASGLNAIAHCVEALYAEDGNPIVAIMAEEGIAALARGLPALLTQAQDLATRAQCQYGAWLAGMTLNAASIALHHKLCHVLGGTLNLPHAQTHAIILPYATAYNAPAAPEAMQAIGRALMVEDAPLGLYKLARRLGAPAGLQALGVDRGQLDLIADLSVQTPYPNPRALERNAMRELLEQAYAGEAPQAI